MISNGPFILDEWSINKVIKVKRNNNYWGKANLKLNGIHFFPIDNESTSDRYYRSGKTHNLYTIQTEKLLNIKKNTRINLNWRSISARTTIVSILRLNH